MNEWMIYGATSVTGKKLISHALKHNLHPVIASSKGQELYDLTAQTGLRSCIFRMSSVKEIQSFLKGISIIVVSDIISPREHKRLLKACLLSKVHYIDLSSDLYSFAHAVDVSAKFQSAGLTLIPGLHPSVILSDFVASLLKSRLHDANSLQLACSESFTSIHSMINSLKKGGRVLKNSKLSKPESETQTLLVPFQGTGTLTVAAAQADILTAWHSTRIPNISFFHKTDEREVRLLKFSRWIRFLLYLPFFREVLHSQDNRLIQHFRIKPFHPLQFAVWGRATNAHFKSLTLSIHTVNDFDLSLDVFFHIFRQLSSGQLRSGLLSSSQVLGPDYVLQCEHLSLSFPKD